MLNRLRRILAPPVFPEDGDRTRTAAILNSLLWYLIALSAIAALVGLPLLFAERVGSAISIGALLVVLVGARWLMHQGRVSLASGVLIVSVWSVFAVLSTLTGGIYSSNLAVLAVMSVVASLLSGTRWAIGTAVATSLLALAFVLVETAGYSLPKPFPAPPLSRWAVLSFALSMALVPLAMSLRSVAQALEAARRELRVRLEAEEALRRSEERFRTIYDSMNEAVFIHDPTTGAILDVNRKMTEMYGWTREEALGLPATAASSGQAGFRQEDAEALLKRGALGEVLSFEWHARRRDGTLFWAEVNLRLAEIGGQRVLLATVRDIDDRKRAKAERDQLEEQLRQAQKLESIGRLAGGVAHDFNNLLTGILGNLELALLEQPLSDVVRAHLKEAERAGQRAAELTSQLLTFSRKQLIQPQVLKLKDLLEGLKKMLSRLLGEDIELISKAAPDLWLVEADRTQIEQVVVNLAVNARDAMPQGGKLILELENVDLSEGLNPEETPGPYVCLRVKDTGVGIPADIMANIFEPFFTTKPRGKGTGLGLAMVFGAVKQNRGFLRVHSTPGQGATFELYFPKADQPEKPASPGPKPVQMAKGREVLVVVEDEPSVREIARLTLQRLGYQVHVFAKGEDLLEALPSLGPIDLLVSDIVLPGINGSVLAERCKEIRPALRVLLMSGYTDDAIAQHGVVQQGQHLLVKPFQAQTLADRVRTVLDEVKAS